MTTSDLVQRLGNILDTVAKTEDKDSWIDYLEALKNNRKSHRLITILPEKNGFLLEILLLINLEERLENQVKHMQSEKRHQIRRCFLCKDMISVRNSWFFRGIPLTPGVYLQIPICVQTKCRGILEFETTTEMPPRKVCAGCYKPKVFFQCNFCKSASYCSLLCREMYWETHKHICRKLAKIYFKSSG